VAVQTTEQPELTGALADYDQLKLDFFAWLMDPDRERNDTMRAWAERNGVHEDTLSKWKNSEEGRQILLRWQEPYKTRFVEIARALHTVATDPTHDHMVQAARTLADIYGLFAPKKIEGEITHTVTGLYKTAAAALEGDFTEE
jgi:hypothetical protein